MRRFVLRENIKLLERQLLSAPDKAVLQAMIDEAWIELAALECLWKVSCPDLGTPNALGENGEDTLDRAVRVNGADFGSLQIWNGQTQALSLIAQTNFDSCFVRRFAQVRDGDGSVCAEALRSARLVTVADIEEHETFAPHRPWAREAGVRAIVTCPILDKGSVIGCYSLHFRQPLTGAMAEGLFLSAYRDGFADLLSAMRSPWNRE